MRRKGEIIVKNKLKRYVHSCIPVYTLLNYNVIIIMCSFFDRPDIYGHHFVVYYSGHGKGTGDWFLPDWSHFTLEQILAIWSEYQHHSRAHDQELLLIMDSCYSGINVRRLDYYHKRGQYENVEIIAASHGETKSNLTKAICDMFPNEWSDCPVETVCTRSLISKSKSSMLFTVGKDDSKRFLQLKWKF